MQLSDYGQTSCSVPRGSLLGPLLFLVYVNDMSQAAKSNVNDSCLMYKHFENFCNWFVDNKFSIDFGEDKTKSILFASKLKIKSANIKI